MSADPLLDQVVDTLLAADPAGDRTARVLRFTFDQLYDGRHTGRYRWDQLFKTEKTHFGTIFEINYRREFDGVIADGQKLDYLISGHEVDCKYSQRQGGWMLPPESFGELLLVATADDARSRWSVGVVRAKPEYLRVGVNRDAKSGLNVAGRDAVYWLWKDAGLPPNVLLQLDEIDVAAIFAAGSGQKRLNELFRRAEGRIIGRNTIATVAQQDDFMKRVRTNGGARSILAKEGYLIPGGDYGAHRRVAQALGVQPPSPGEVVSIRVTEAAQGEPWAVELDGRSWRRTKEGERPSGPAPSLPSTNR